MSYEQQSMPTENPYKISIPTILFNPNIGNKTWEFTPRKSNTTLYSLQKPVDYGKMSETEWNDYMNNFLKNIDLENNVNQTINSKLGIDALGLANKLLANQTIIDNNRIQALQQARLQRYAGYDKAALDFYNGLSDEYKTEFNNRYGAWANLDGTVDRNAIKKWQQANGLTADGLFGNDSLTQFKKGPIQFNVGSEDDMRKRALDALQARTTKPLSSNQQGNAWDGFTYSLGLGEWWKPRLAKAGNWYLDAAGNDFDLIDESKGADDISNRQYRGGFARQMYRDPGYNHLSMSKKEFYKWYQNLHPYNGSPYLNGEYLKQMNQAYEGWLNEITHGKNSWSQFKKGGRLIKKTI